MRSSFKSFARSIVTLSFAYMPLAHAAPVTIYLEGQYSTFGTGTIGASHPYSAEIKYDTETSFGPYFSGPTLVAGDQFSQTAYNLGSITVFANGQSDTATIYSMIVSKNSDSGQPGSIFSPPTHSYSANIIFYSSKYIFGLGAYNNPVPFSWGDDLLPSAANPVPFYSPNVSPSYHLQAQQVQVSFVVNSYSVDGVSQVPIPASAWLLGSGLIGLVATARKRKAH